MILIAASHFTIWNKKAVSHGKIDPCESSTKLKPTNSAYDRYEIARGNQFGYDWLTLKYAWILIEGYCAMCNFSIYGFMYLARSRIFTAANVP